MYQGNELFIIQGAPSTINVQDFWKWGYSNFIDNVQRGVLAESIVANAIGAINEPSEKSRIIWRPFDVLSPEGWRILTLNFRQDYKRL